MKKVLTGVLVLVNIVLAVGLLLAFGSRYISPKSLVELQFFGLSFPFWLAGNVLFLVIWTLMRRRWFLLSFVPLLMGWGIVRDYVRVGVLPSQESGTYKLFDQNVRLFGFYEWNENEALRDGIIKRLKIEQADILCFQEFYYRSGDWKDLFVTRPLVIDATGATNLHEKYTHEFRYDQRFGVVTMSKHPIIAKGEIAFEGEINNFCIYSDILLPEADTIRVFNAHLASIHFRKEDYKLVEASKEGEIGRWENLMGTADKLAAGFKTRAMQVEQVAAEVARSPYPVIFAGDLNDTPVSYAYAQLDELLEDAFHSGGQGLGNTYNGSTPYLRIDHVMHSEEIRVNSYRIEPDDFSDHFPVIIEFDMP
jgi:endonuclease/exonuclease/phosphatase family metal-dependent hydrolase